MTQFFKLKDLTITGITVTSSLAGLVTLLLATDYKLLYLANFFSMFADATTIGIRSALSKIVGEKDVGKVMVFTTLGSLINVLVLITVRVVSLC